MCSRPLQPLKTDTVYENKGVVWSFQFVSEKEMLVTHRNGKFFLYNMATKKSAPIKTPKLVVDGQGGLLDVLPR